MKNIDTDPELALSLSNAHPYFPLTDLGRKACIGHGKRRHLLALMSVYLDFNKS